MKTLEINGIQVDLWRGSVRIRGTEGLVPVMSVDTLKTIIEWVEAVK
jgi:hypothetical protein